MNADAIMQLAEMHHIWRCGRAPSVVGGSPWVPEGGGPSQSCDWQSKVASPGALQQRMATAFFPQACASLELLQAIEIHVQEWSKTIDCLALLV